METQLCYQGDRRPIHRPRYSIHPTSRHRIARSELGYRKKSTGAIAHFHNRLPTAEAASPVRSAEIKSGSNPKSESGSESASDSEPDEPLKILKKLSSWSQEI